MDLEEILKSKHAGIEQSHRVARATTALLVIDMQHGFLEPGASLEVPSRRRRLLRLFGRSVSGLGVSLPRIATRLTRRLHA